MKIKKYNHTPSPREKSHYILPQENGKKKKASIKTKRRRKEKRRK